MVTCFAGVALASGVAARFVAPFLFLFPSGTTRLTSHVNPARMPTVQTVCAGTASVATEVLIEFMEVFLSYNLFICLEDTFYALVFFCMKSMVG